MDFQFRNVYNEKVVSQLGKRIAIVYPGFDKKEFCNAINPYLHNLTFGERSTLIKKNLKLFLPTDFTKAATILIDSLGPELSIEPGKTDWDGFIIVPLSEYIAENGLEHYELSMKALYEMTKRFSSENAIRPFIRKYPHKTLNLLKVWAKDKNVHVRRLVSEGTRPRLPLCSPLIEFKKDPSPVLSLLTLLKDDKELYVRRSVANNLNDIAKDNPAIVVATLREWKKDAPKTREWVISHALRTLFKKENKAALALMGFTKPEVTDATISLDKKIHRGERGIFSFSFTTKKSQKLMIDYVIYYMKANGRHSDKVFKLSVRNVNADEHVTVRAKHSFKQMTTRKHYPGIHYVELMINGCKYAKQKFMLE